jgi:hypothetical protein
MVVQVLSSVNEISSLSWARLDESRTLYETQGWLSANEAAPPGEPLISAEFDQVRGLTSVVAWIVSQATDPSPYYNIAGLLVRHKQRQSLPAGGWTLNCSGVGLHSPILAAPGIVFDARRLLAHVKAVSETRDQQPVMCGINFLPQCPAPGLTASLAELGFTEFKGHQRAVLEITGNSYSDYLDSLSKSKRMNALRDRRLFAGTGQRISFATGPAAAGEDLIRLQGNNRVKYGLTRGDQEVRIRHSSLLSHAGDDGLVIRSYRGSVCTGFSMFRRMGTTLYALSVGFDETDDKISPYFECLFHAAIEWSYANGIKEIDYGIGSGLAKNMRGCRLVDVSTWYLSPGEGCLSSYRGDLRAAHGSCS